MRNAAVMGWNARSWRTFSMPPPAEGGQAPPRDAPTVHAQGKGPRFNSRVPHVLWGKCFRKATRRHMGGMFARRAPGALPFY